MLETLIQQSPLSGTGLEIDFRHEMTLDRETGDWRYWLVTRKDDGTMLWLKAPAGSADCAKSLADECRVIERLASPGLAIVSGEGTAGQLPYTAFCYGGEILCDEEALAGLSDLETLSFGLSICRLIHALETARPPVALGDFGMAPLLMSPALKRPVMLGLGKYDQTAAAEPHQKGRKDAWHYVSTVLGNQHDGIDSPALTDAGLRWIDEGPEQFPDLNMTFNSVAFELATRDL